MNNLPCVGAENPSRLRPIRLRGTVKGDGRLSLTKVSPSGSALDDHGTGRTDPKKSHIGIRNLIDLPTVRGRRHGS